MAKKKAATAPAGGGETKVNVSEAIRLYLAENPEVKPKDGAKAVSEQLGKEVTPAMYSQIKTKTKKGGSGKPKGTTRGRRVGNLVPGGGAKAGNLIEALKELVSKLGADAVKSLVDVLGGWTSGG